MTTSRHRILGVAVAACATTLAIAPAASAASGHPGATTKWHRTLTNEVLAPFQIAVSKGKVYVADGFTGTVSRVDGNHLTPLAHGLPGGDVAGLDVADDGSWAYTTSVADPVTNIHTAAQLVIKKPGKADKIVDLAAYEASANPDGSTAYGLAPGTDCQAGRDWLAMASGSPASYTGVVDSHPYAVASLGHGAWAVADAGGNDIVKVTADGTVSTIAVLPAQKTAITPGLLGALGAPPSASCLVGKVFGFEAVPTDVEQGPDGKLWVSTLPGGPEDPSLGARGSVYAVGPYTGGAKLVATGFLGATNVAPSDYGTAFVTELFGGKVDKITQSGKVTTFATIDAPLAVEVQGDGVYVATLAAIDNSTGQVLAPGSIVKYKR
ncbi:ScyD/ScyE family protein [Lapillicoccus sp.]|uniref:ScyD/ScyE family protein n=1 Tax=Lapillicoccus sp. TaxID=1909287 RepID=UPI0027CCD391|nr:ScyD/ScyE family protein [Actinomycetota bacterium]